MRRIGWWIAGLALLAFWAWSQRAPVSVSAPRPPPVAARDASPPLASPERPGRSPSERGAHRGALPREALDTLRRIADGGPFAHRQDGQTFQNRERRLPARERGWYREYTVPTPGSRDRGARRIVAGGRPPSEYFYTDDHYRSFRRIAADGTEPAR